jgi:hypothetical protein
MIGRRGLLWGSLAAGIAGLAGGVWWRQRDGDLRAITLKNPRPVLAALAASPWVGPMRGGAILWVVGFRGCPWCAAFERVEVPKFLANGVDVRSFVFPPSHPETGAITAPSEERAVLATLYASRDEALLKDWFATNAPITFAAERGLPPVDDIPGGKASLTAAVSIARRLEGLFSTETKSFGYPALVWQRGGEVRAAFGYRRYTGKGVFDELTKP